MFGLAQFYPLMKMEMEGQSHSTRIATGVAGLVDHDFSSLALLVLTIAIAAPLLRIFSMIWVLGCLHLQHRPAYLTRIFRISEQLRRWEMLDVCLLGSIVAFSKLHNLAHMDIGTGFWALGLVVLALIALEATFDRQAIWNMLYPPSFDPSPPAADAWISCHTCELLQPIGKAGESGDLHCRRCGSALHRRKPGSLSRTWALVIAGFVLYIPANAYPVMTIISFGREEPSTIMGGVRQLSNGSDWPLALIVFTASVVIPLLKLLGFIWLMISVQQRSQKHLINRTRLYSIIRVIGRWSNVDIFVAALLTGLVTLGNIATVEPGNGVLAFGAVVVLTMLATESFDPRLIWDAAENRNG
jgi:paraquat-inducible protein A